MEGLRELDGPICVIGDVECLGQQMLTCLGQLSLCQVV